MNTMEHVRDCLNEMAINPASEYIKLRDVNSNPEVSFLLQSGPASTVGVNGLQVRELIEFSLELIRSYSKTVPCRENAITITKLQEALMWQEERTRDRYTRGVEGKEER